MNLEDQTERPPEYGLKIAQKSLKLFEGIIYIKRMQKRKEYDNLFLEIMN